LKANIENKYDMPVLDESAVTKENIPEFRELLKEKVGALYNVRYPYQKKFW